MTSGMNINSYNYPYKCYSWSSSALYFWPSKTGCENKIRGASLMRIETTTEKNIAIYFANNLFWAFWVNFENLKLYIYVYSINVG